MRFGVIIGHLQKHSKTTDYLLEKITPQLLLKGSIDRIDLRDIPLPLCDGYSCYLDPRVIEVKKRMTLCDAYILIAPVYNYAVPAALKNLIELTGYPKRLEDGTGVWFSKPVTLFMSVGTIASSLAGYPFMNSLMADFQSFVFPKVTMLSEKQLDEEGVSERVETHIDSFISFATALRSFETTGCVV